MQYGVIYPQTEYPPDPAAIRDYVQAAEELGYSHVLAYDHILGANPDREGGWSGPYTHEHSFLEPFTLFSYMAALTERIAFTTGILVLPQRNTPLVAKQAAILDRLCGGRFRMGVGVGWNRVEYEGLGHDFSTRGQRVEEQVEVLRLLWTQPLVTYEGRWHSLPDVGINPLPVQQPIPIWFGGHAHAVLERIARLGDGWLPNYRSAEDAAESLTTLDRALENAGRSRSDIGIEARVYYGRDPNPDDWTDRIAGWRFAGATHITLNTMGAGLDSPGAHIDAIRHFATEVGVSAPAADDE